MDKVVIEIIAALKSEQQTLLQALGDFPQMEPFEHGMAVGTYQGVKLALDVIESVLEEISKEEERR